MNEHAGLPPQPTSSLKHFDVLVGEWNTVGTHPAFPSPVHGHSSFAWLMEGALLLWHFDWERGGPPSALSVLGHEDSVATCSVLYCDERGLAMIYQMRLAGGVWKLRSGSALVSERKPGTVGSDR